MEYLQRRSLRFGPALWMTLGLASTSPAVAAPSDSTAAIPGRTITSLEKYSHLAAFLSLAQGTVRIVAFLSPSDPTTPVRLETILAVLGANPSKRLRAYVVLTAIAPGDDTVRATQVARNTPDRRLNYFWDASGTMWRPWEASVGSEDEPVVGVIRLYDTSARFAEQAPGADMIARPTSTGDADARRLRARVDELVRRVEAKHTDALRTSP
jgi:hypothetical protein